MGAKREEKSKLPKMTEITFGSHNVRFPYEPYQAQKAYMEKVIECLEQKKFGLLESPTGTGKTLALLCSSIAFLESFKVSGNAQAKPDADSDIKALLRGELSSSGNYTFGRNQDYLENL